MSNSIKVKTHFNANEIRQVVQGDPPPSLARSHAEHVLNLRDEGVRKALKELGWISPEDSKGMALVPREITAESGHKAGVMGEFSETVLMRCEECDGDGLGGEGEEYGGCSGCDGAGEYAMKVPVSWTTLKAIHRRIVEIAEAALAGRKG